MFLRKALCVVSIFCLSQSFPDNELHDRQASLQVEELFSVEEVTDSDATPERSLSLSIARYHHEGKRCGGRRTSISLTANRRIAPLSLSRRVPKRFALDRKPRGLNDSHPTEYR